MLVQHVLKICLCRRINNVWSKAVDAILRIRDGANLGNKFVQKFVVPQLTFALILLKHYSDIKSLCHEPIFTTSKAFDENIPCGEKKFEVKQHPNHSRFNGRLVK